MTVTILENGSISQQKVKVLEQLEMPVFIQPNLINIHLIKSYKKSYKGIATSNLKEQKDKNT